MAQPAPYRYYLRGFIGGSWRYYYIDSNGDFADTITQTELPMLPQGWQDLEISWERGFVYYGLYTNYTTPLKFVKDGAKILRHLMYTNGVEAPCELWVEKFNPDSGVYDYETFFKADLDFSTFNDEKDYVTIAVMENGFPAKLKARENTPYIIDIWNHPNVQYIKHDGIFLQGQLVYKTFDTAFPTGIDGYSLTPNISYLDTEGTNVALKPYDVDNTTWPHFVSNTYGASLDVTISVNGQFESELYVGASNGDFVLGCVMIDSTGAFVSRHDIYRNAFAQLSNTTVTYDIVEDLVITLPDGYALIFACYYRNHSTNAIINSSLLAPVWQLNYAKSDLKVKFDNRYETSYVPMLKAIDVYTALLDKISDGDATLTATSNLLSSTYEDLIYITSGDGMRNLLNCCLTTTFADFFKFINTHLGAAFYYNQVNNECFLETKESVYDYLTTMSIVLDSVNSVSVRPFTEGAFTNLKIGNRKFSYDEKGYINEITNGKDEFNTTLEFLSPYVRVKKTEEYISPYRTDMYGIEMVRVNLDGKDLADYKSDTDVFVIHAEADNSNTYTLPFPYYTTPGGVSTTVTSINYHNIYRRTLLVGTWEIDNIYSPETVYNVMFSPKRAMLNNGTYFRSLFKMNDNDAFVYQTSPRFRNSGVYFKTTENGTIVIDERADQNIYELCSDGTELFYPFIVELETKEPLNIYTIIRDYGYYAIEFTWNGVNYFAFIISASTKPVIRGTSKFKLLLTRDNDPLNLIR